MLKLVTPYCITSLRSIQNFSITASTYPSMWKTSIIVIPTLEKAAWDKIADLRPISLLSILAKPFVKNAINYLKTKKTLCLNCNLVPKTPWYEHSNYKGFEWYVTLWTISISNFWPFWTKAKSLMLLTFIFWLLNYI